MIIATSIQPEVYLDVHLHWHWRAVFGAGGESPLSHRLDCLFIESHPQRPRDPNVAGLALRINHKCQHDYPLMFDSARLIRIFRLGIVDRARRDDGHTRPVRPAAITY